MKKNKKESSKNPLILIYTVGILLTILSFFIDKQIILLFKNINIPIIDKFLLWITEPLSVVIILVIMTSLFLYNEKKKEWVIPLWLSFGLTFAITYGIKYIINRTRPYIALNLPSLLTISSPSFPSAHAAIVFSTIPILDREFPKLKYFWITFALIVCFSRLYFKAHYLSDIIFGGLIGYALGLFFYNLEKKYKILR